MSNHLIYEPKGRAREYSPLACNLFTGCIHSCKYCYSPNVLHQTTDDYNSGIKIKDNVVEKFKKDAKKFQGDKRDILFSFFSDVYQNKESAELMREVLLICEEYDLRVQILTKAGGRAVRDFDIIKRNNWKFGSTICFLDEKLREEWEPGAPSIQSRLDAVKEAHGRGIFTWISIEPVVCALEALKVMDELMGYVDLWKVGKLNHFPKIEAEIGWKKFLMEAMAKLNGERTIFKNDLIAVIDG